jgi:hypothetical protein
MSKYVLYYNDRQDACRTLATQYLNWKDSIQSNPETSAEFSKFFTKVAKRFGLITEFRARGVI